MKIAILVDGGFFDAVNKNRVNGMLPTADHVKQEVDNTMRLIRAKTLTDSENIKDVLFRVYFYDARPFSGKKTNPQGEEYDFTLSKSYVAKTDLLNELARTDKFCLRLGMLSFAGWQPKIDDNGTLTGYRPSFKQKGVDIKVGMDMVWIATHKVVDKIVITAITPERNCLNLTFFFMLITSFFLFLIGFLFFIVKGHGKLRIFPGSIHMDDCGKGTVLFLGIQTGYLCLTLI